MVVDFEWYFKRDDLWTYRQHAWYLQWPDEQMKLQMNLKYLNSSRSQDDPLHEVIYTPPVRTWDTLHTSMFLCVKCSQVQQRWSTLNLLSTPSLRHVTGQGKRWHWQVSQVYNLMQCPLASMTASTPWFSRVLDPTWQIQPHFARILLMFHGLTCSSYLAWKKINVSWKNMVKFRYLQTVFEIKSTHGQGSRS